MSSESRPTRLLKIFLTELEEQVRAMNRSLLELEQRGVEAGAAALAQLLRSVHSLKGAARSVDIALVETACHELEGTLLALREGSPAAPPYALLFAVLDAMEDAGRLLAAGQDLRGARLAALIPALKGVTRHPEAAAPDEGAAQVTAPPQGPAAPERLDRFRVPVAKVTRLIDDTGELVAALSRLASQAADLKALLEASDVATTAGARLGAAARLTAEVALADRAARRVDQAARELGMLPFADACQGLDRGVRDLAGVSGKEVDLVIEGGGIELDRSLHDALRQPLYQLARNAVDHGIESPAARVAAGKARAGRIVVAATIQGAEVQVSVVDDGAGVPLDKVRTQLARRSLAVPESDDEVLRAILVPGLSTTETVTAVSGRGLGLDLVATRVKNVHGRIDIASQAGSGTTITLRLPLTLTTLPALLLRAGGRPWAVPSSAVERVTRVPEADLKTVDGRPVATIAGRAIFAAPLADLLGTPPAEEPRARQPAVVIRAGERRAVLLVEELLEERDVYLKRLGRRFRRAPHLVGGTVLADGAICLLLDPGYLISAAEAWRGERAPAPPPPRRRRVLVAEDALTTRTLMKSILEGAGYDVSAAADGAMAWRLIEGGGIDLVVSDIDMPGLDGLALTRSVRRSARWAAVPVVLITAQLTESERVRGLEAGADACLLKRSFDQSELLATVARLLR